ncbi:hypothetical protein JHN53_22770 [Streptomyces sp. MBT58]|uniref:hypothetical protein n=1 Tax=Streptomyces sp. MBT58 TaxID=1488389 RepID=UPI001914B8F9|nr:hypothetical protein [Streptomyces sp. MBT58]MBK5994417.1 hypothetical protein [Streptomyces sp. MBT58]
MTAATVLYALIGLGLGIGALLAAALIADHLITTRTRARTKGPLMPEPLPFLLLAVLLGAAVHRLFHDLGASRTPVTPPPLTRAADPEPWAACHNIACGAHNRTPHRTTAEGLVCEDCGQLTPRTP